ncbi:hypothetical protein CW736_11630 [Nonlabens sp. MB-3u-79]|uniref:T9SS type A sorting domain-containing protein n=1 Tax=Nonlabens sp. MB-3u-79 TaxID=2058134 RepID=UPI000C303A04|nr:T9SS type A sorting domain-containing protein [Nonlabens sp. MB-3u-79]AUC79974.1 hypothetical protein CW736_11630 [Nonlabens sp. MB-3u-79]
MEYDDNVDEFGVLVPIEEISEEVCIKFCENTEVTFSLSDPDGNIDSILWDQAGGITSSANQNPDFTVVWNNVANSGNISVQVTLLDGTIIRKAICVEVIATPIAAFTFLSGLNDRCEGDFQAVNNSFDPSGSNLISHEWTFTNTNGTVISSSDVEPNVYLGQGTWTIDLTVTNECNCSETTRERIRVEGESISITCPTVICENSVETYTVENPGLCDLFAWEVEGGTILSGNNDSIVEVIWNDPQDGFGYLNFIPSNCDACQNVPVTVKIPVIEEEGTIIGEEELCAGEEYLFSLPRWPATVFEWNLLDGGGNSLPFPVDFDITDQPNEIVLNTTDLEPGEYILNSNYNSPLLLCGGFAQRTVSIRDKHVIQAETEVCLNEEVSFTTENVNNNTEWSIYFENDLIDQQTTSQLINYSFNTPGVYIITASSPAHCTSDNFLITVIDLPPAIDPSIAIEGTLEQVCAGTPYSYSIDLNNDDYYAEWRIVASQGTIQGNTEGETVSVVFNSTTSTNYDLEVRQVSKNGGCAGSWLAHQITPLSIITEIDHYDPANPNINPRDGFFCSSSVAFFRVDYELGETYEWFFDDERYGSIIAGQNTHEVTIMFNELPIGISQGNPTNLNVRIRKCGQLTNITPYRVSLSYVPPTVLTPPQDVCSGETTNFTVSFVNLHPQADLSTWVFDWEFLVNGSTAGGFTGIPIPQPNAIIQITPQNQLLISNVEVPFVDNPTLYTFRFNYRNMDGCTTSVGNFVNPTTFILPSPNVDVIASGDTSFCSVADIDVTLSAIYQNTNLGPVNYQWLRNGNIIPGQTGTTLVVNPTVNPFLGVGNYSCAISFPNNNPNGCVSITEDIPITIRDCSADPICTNEQIAITSVNWADCKEIQVAVDNFGGSPSSVEYTVRGSNWDIVSSNSTSATLESNSDLPAGTYTMLVKAIYPNCSTTDSVPFTIGYQAAIDTSVGCVTPNSNEITVNSTGTILNTYVGATVSYGLVGFGTSVTNTLGSHTFTNVPDGVYTARVLISGPGDPVCIAEQEVVLNSPDAAFEILDAREAAINTNAGPITQTCMECPILLRPINSNPNHTYTWGFLTDGSNTQVSPEISLPVGIQDINLTVTDENGCSVTSPFQQIEVTEGVFTGPYFGSGTYCEGAQIDLTFFNTGQQTIAAPNTIPAESGYLWMLETDPAPGINTEAIYNPTVSGQYWVKLRNTDLCLDDIDPINVTILPKPFFDIELPEVACVGQPYQVTGLSTAAGSGIDEYRWIIDGTTGPWLNTFPIEPLEETQNTAGTYTYILEVAADNTCNYTVEKEVIVTPVPNLGGIIITPDSCNPYAVTLSVQSPQAGTYHWSDGFTGYPHTVTRGGSYQLTFVPDNSACTVELQTYLDKDPSSYLWYFPSGCLDFCGKEDFATRVIPGLSVPFQSWNYDSNGSSLSGTGSVNDFDITPFLGANDAITLELENSNCAQLSDPLVITQNEECGDCELELDIDFIELIETPFIYFEIYGNLVNNSPFDLNIQLSITGGNGFFTPSSITIPSGSSFSLNPLRFTPQSPFSGGNLLINMDASHREGNCITQTEVKFPEVQIENENREGEKSTLTISPNPVDQKATFTYELFEKDLQQVQLEIYDLNGLRMYHSVLKNTNGSIEVEVSHFKPTQYIVLIKSNGKILIQNYLIKK